MSRLKVLAVILLFSLITSGMLWAFDKITILWTVHIVQETFERCPKVKTHLTEIDIEYPEVGHRNLLK